MPDIASLGIELDSRPVTAGKDALDALADAADRLEPAIDGATGAVDALGESVSKVGQKTAVSNGQMSDTAAIMKRQADAARAAEDANNAFLAALQREIDTFGLSRSEMSAYNAAKLGLSDTAQREAAALGATIDALRRDEQAMRDAAAAEDQAAKSADAFIKKLQDQVATLNMNSQQLTAYRAAQLGVADTAAPLIAQLGAAGHGLDGLTLSSTRSRQELVVLAHELSTGNYSRFGSSIQVLAESTGAASLLFSAAGVAALGLAAAVGVSGYAMIKGASEQKAMNDALILTGDYAGVTSDGLNDLAHAAAATGGSIGDAKKAVTELAASGKFTGDQIGTITGAVIDLEHATGQSIDTTIKQFESLAVQAQGSSVRASDAVSRATLKLDDEYHFLTEAVLEQIGALEKEGDAKAASSLATDAFAKALHDRAEEINGNLGTIAAGWNSIKSAIGGAVDAVGNWGKKSTPASKVASIQGEITSIDNGSYGALHGSSDGGYDQDTLARLRAADVIALAAAQKDLNAVNQAASDQSAKAIAQSAASHAASRIMADDVKLQKKSMTDLQVALDEYYADINKIKAANPDSILVTPAAVADHVAAITKAHTPAAKAPQVDQADATALQDQLKRFDDEAAATKKHDDDLSKLDDMYRKAGELSDQQFYDNKRKYSADTAAAQISSYDKEIEALAAHNNSTVAEEAKTQKQINDIDAKRTAAVAANAAEQYRLDEEERLRQKAIADASDDAGNKYISSLNAQAAAIDVSTGARARSKSSVEDETIALYKLAAANLADQVAAPVDGTHTQADVDAAQKFLDVLNQELAAHEKISAALKQQESDAANKKLADQAIEDWKNAGSSIANSLSDAFGVGGKALGSMLKSYADGVSAQLEINKKLADSTKGLSDQDPAKIAAVNQAQQASADAQLKSYGDMASAASGFFDTQSKGYQTVMAISQVFHAAELAMTLAELVPKAISAVLTQGSGDPYTAFARMAAMVAIVAGLGVAIGGGGGAVDTSKSTQATAGTGTVLGDPTAKSDSITNALTAVQKNTYEGLNISNAMLTQLQAINTNLGNLGGLVTQQLGLTASGDSQGAAAQVQVGKTSNIGFGSAFSILDPYGDLITNILEKIPVIGGLVSKLFGSTTSITDEGIKIDSTSLSDAIISGIKGVSYADTQTTSKFFGITTGSSSGEQTQALSDELNSQFTLVIKNLHDGTLAAADALGLGGDAFDAKLNSFVVDLGKISLEGLTGDQITTELNNVFSKLGDDMASFAVDGLTQFQQVGEGAFQTLTRIATDYQTVDAVLQSFGDSFGAVGFASVAARENLISLSGGLDQFTSQADYFLKNFFTDAEQAAQLKPAVDAQIESVNNGQTVTTTEQFKNLVLSLDLTTAAGEQAYATLMNIAPAFEQIVQAAGGKSAADIASERSDLQDQLDNLTMTSTQLLEKQRDALDASNQALFDQVQAAQAAANAESAAVDAITSARSALSDAYNTEVQNLQSVVTAKQAEAAATRQQIDALKLGTLSALSPEQKYEEAKSEFASAAPGADKDAAAEAFLTASQQYNGSTAAYAKDYAAVQAGLVISAAQSDAAATTAQSQLTALQDMISPLLGIQQGTETIAELVRDLNAALLNQKETAVAAPNQDEAILTSLYQGLLGRAPDASGLAFWEAAMKAGTSLDSIITSFESSPEYLKLNGAHANGGVASGWSLVGENGPEIANFSQLARIYTAGQTQAILSGGGSSNDGKAQTAAILRQNELLEKQNDLLEGLNGKVASSDDIRSLKQHMATTLSRKAVPA